MFDAGNYALTELPVEAEIRQSYDYDAAQDKFTESVLEQPAGQAKAQACKCSGKATAA
jgi:hypothetical protein